MKIITIFSLLIFINISSQVQTAINAADKIDFEEMTDLQLVSSHWYPQKTDGTYLSIESRNNKIVENEYYNASIEIRNKGLDLNNLNLTLVLTLNNTIVQREATIEYWRGSTSFNLTFNFIPVPFDMDWGRSFAIFSWKAKNSNDKSLQLNKTISVVPILDKSGKEPVKQENVVDNNPETAGEDQIFPYGQKTSTPIQIRPQTHVAQILDIWEGSSTTKDTKEKGIGPTLYVKIKFNQQVSPGFRIKYTLESSTHTNWLDSYTQYWSGTFLQGYTYTLSLTFGWSFNGVYAFGQGEFHFVSARASNSPFFYPGFSNTQTGTDNEDYFQITDGGTKKDVFLFVIYDKYIADNDNCLTRTPSSYIDEVTNNFELIMDVNYYTVIKQNEWLGSVSGGYWRRNDGCNDNQLYVSDKDINDVDTAANIGVTSALGLSSSWKEGSSGSKSTYKNNHGFDQAHAMSGLLRSQSSSSNTAIGRADLPGNIGWSVAGWEEYTYLPFPSSDYRFEITIRHEISHTWGAIHRDLGYNIMNSSPYLQNYNWYQWSVDEM
ncbi:MAG: hypothetical protein ACC656_05050, partial [Candidatus Heimdallarchaeota archaeon]